MFVGPRGERSGHGLTRAERVRQFLDEVGHLDGDDYDGEPDELDGQLERALLGADRVRAAKAEERQQRDVDGQQAGDGGGRHEVFHRGDPLRTEREPARRRAPRRVKVDGRRTAAAFRLETKAPLPFT